MKFFKYTLHLALLAIFLVAPAVQAETVVRTGNSVSLSDDQTVAGDFYGLARPISLSGTIEGDAQVVGASITTNGTIGADLFALGGSVQVHASVTDDVRIVGGDMTIAESVGGDVFVIGGILTVLSTADIAGDLYFYGGEVEMNGSVGGSVRGLSEAVRIDGSVGGDVDVRTYDLELGERADVAGSVRYESPRELARAQNAVVVGDIVRNDFARENRDARDILIPFLIYAFSALILLAVFRPRLEVLLNRGVKQFTHNGLIGLGATIFLPVAIALTIATMIGMLIGVIAFLFTLILYLVAFLLAGSYMGLLLNIYFRKQHEVTLLSTLAGMLVLFIIVGIPIIGPAVLFTFTVVILGTMLRVLYEQLF